MPERVGLGGRCEAGSAGSAGGTAIPSGATDVSPLADPEGLQVLRRADDPRVRAGADGRRRPERQREVEHRRRGGVGAGRPGAPHACARPRWTTSSSPAPAGARRWGGPRSASPSTTPAGLLPIDFTEVTITRTLFRTSGESEYAINGVPCRLLDIQELLSDTGVGPPAARHRVPGQPRRRPRRPARGPPPDRRGGGRHPQVPPAQGEGRAPAGGHRGQPGAPHRPAAGGRPPAEAPGAPGRRRPPPRRPGPPSCTRCGSSCGAGSWRCSPPATRPRSQARAGLVGDEAAAARPSCAGLDTSVAAAEARVSALGRRPPGRGRRPAGGAAGAGPGPGGGGGRAPAVGRRGTWR